MSNRIGLALILMVFLFGCAQQSKLYYFGNYSQTLYKSEKNRTEESINLHKQELEKIIASSKEKNLTIPPGIYAELGYLSLKENKTDIAIELFAKESEIYPESKYLMDRLIQKAQSQKNM